MLNEPRCSERRCKHFEGAVVVDDEKGTKKKPEIEDEGIILVCKAFPGGIPAEIAYGDNLHIAPFKGDNGIRFEPIEEG